MNRFDLQQKIADLFHSEIYHDGTHSDFHSCPCWLQADQIMCVIWPDIEPALTFYEKLHAELPSPEMVEELRQHFERYGMDEHGKPNIRDVREGYGDSSQ